MAADDDAQDIGSNHFGCDYSRLRDVSAMERGSRLCRDGLDGVGAASESNG